jgi:hypothetical protein
MRRTTKPASCGHSRRRGRLRQAAELFEARCLYADAVRFAKSGVVNAGGVSPVPWRSPLLGYVTLAPLVIVDPHSAREVEAVALRVLVAAEITETVARVLGLYF